MPPAGAEPAPELAAEAAAPEAEVLEPLASSRAEPRAAAADEGASRAQPRAAADDEGTSRAAPDDEAETEGDAEVPAAAVVDRAPPAAPRRGWWNRFARKDE